jgi:hypothetical protein
MPGFAEIAALFHKKLDSPEVTAFLQKYPDHRIGKPNSGMQHISFKSLGFSLLFEPLTGAQGGPSKHLRVMICVFLYRAGHDKSKQFANPPFGISFQDTAADLDKRLGPPQETSLPNGTQDLLLGTSFWSRWEQDDLDVHAEFDPQEMTIQQLTISLRETPTA